MIISRKDFEPFFESLKLCNESSEMISPQSFPQIEKKIQGKGFKKRGIF